MVGLGMFPLGRCIPHVGAAASFSLSRVGTVAVKGYGSLSFARVGSGREVFHGRARGRVLVNGSSQARGLGMRPSHNIVGWQLVRCLSSHKRPEEESEKLPTPSPKLTLKNRILSLTPHENIYTVPNILTFTRLLSAPLVGYLVLHDQHAWAVGLFAYAGITDLVDGWIARRWKLQTVIGTVIDPMADKMLMTVLTGCLAWKGGLPVWLAVIILGRDILLGISAIYYRYISLPPPKTFSRYWDFSLPSAEVHPTGISKVNTALQLGLIGWTVGMPLLTGIGWGAGTGVETALIGMQYLIATTTIWSGASYIYTKDAVKILSQGEREEEKSQEK